MESFVAASGCDSTVTLTVTAPEAELSFDPNTVTLSGSSNLEGWVLTHNGNFMGQSSGSTLNVPNISLSGTYVVTFGSTDCGLGTVTLTQSADNVAVTVPSATPPIAANISWPSNPLGFNSTWAVGQHNYPGMAPSAYTLVLTDANGCSETLNFSVNLSPNPMVFISSLPTAPCVATASVEVDLLSVAINESSASTWSIYPNPASTSFTVNGLTAGSTITVMDAMGRNVMNQAVSASRMEVSVAGLSAGIYMVQVQEGNEVRTARLVVNQ